MISDLVKNHKSMIIKEINTSSRDLLLLQLIEENKLEPIIDDYTEGTDENGQEYKLIIEMYEISGPVLSLIERKIDEEEKLGISFHISIEDTITSMKESIVPFSDEKREEYIEKLTNYQKIKQLKDDNRPQA